MGLSRHRSRGLDLVTASASAYVGTGREQLRRRNTQKGPWRPLRGAAVRDMIER